MADRFAGRVAVMLQTWLRQGSHNTVVMACPAVAAATAHLASKKAAEQAFYAALPPGYLAPGPQFYSI
jgi:hypothetical protein